MSRVRPFAVTTGLPKRLAGERQRIVACRYAALCVPWLMALACGDTASQSPPADGGDHVSSATSDESEETESTVASALTTEMNDSDTSTTTTEPSAPPDAGDSTQSSSSSASLTTVSDSFEDAGQSAVESGETTQAATETATDTSTVTATEEEETASSVTFDLDDAGVSDASVAETDPIEAGVSETLFDSGASVTTLDPTATSVSSLTEPVDAGVTEIDAGTVEPPVVPESHALADYSLVLGPLTLPGISSNASDVAWKGETDSFFVAENGAAELHEYDANFSTLLRTVTLTGASADTEAVAYLGQNRFAVAVEVNEVFVFVLADAQTTVNLSTVQRYVVSDPPDLINAGFEGIAFRPGLAPEAATFFVCQEGGDGTTPKRLLSFDDQAEGPLLLSFEDDLVVTEPWDAEVALTLADDLSSLHYDVEDESLLVLSDLSSILLRVAPDNGAVLDQLPLGNSPQYEGVTLAGGDRLVLISEPNFVEVYQAN